MRERSPGLESPAALGFRKLAGKEPPGEIRSQALGPGKDEWRIAQRPRGERANDGIVMNASCGNNHIREAAFDDDRKSATVPRAFEFPLEAFAASADAVCQVPRSLTLDHGSVRVRGQGEIATFQGWRAQAPAFRQQGCPRVRPRLAGVARTIMALSLYSPDSSRIAATTPA